MRGVSARLNWAWFIAHGLVALGVTIIVRFIKGAYIRDVADFGWTVAAAILLAVTTALIGVAIAWVLRRLLWRRANLWLVWRVTSMTLLLLLSVLMVIQA